MTETVTVWETGTIWSSTLGLGVGGEGEAQLVGQGNYNLEWKRGLEGRLELVGQESYVWVLGEETGTESW